MKLAVYPGSFDPFTNGHLDIIRKASELFEKVVIVVAINKNKSRVYDTDKMCVAIESTLKENNITNCVVATWDGLIADLMHNWNVKYLIRGLRNATDYAYEENMANVNKLIYSNIEYIYFRADNSAISSSMVRELYTFGKDISEYVPDAVLNVVKNKGEVGLNERTKENF